MQLLLPIASLPTQFLCVCVCVCVCAHAHVCVCMRAHARSGQSFTKLCETSPGSPFLICKIGTGEDGE